jgi:lipoprotein-anchoring transpeptidase ErfK/SrfK
MESQSNADHVQTESRRQESPQGDGFRFARTFVLAGAVWASLACAAAAPALQQFAIPTATQELRQYWSVAHIAKPTEPVVEVYVAPTATPEMAVPEPSPTPTAAPPSAESGQAPVITMEIVEEAPEPAIIQDDSPAPDAGGKYILVSISEQHLYAYENGQLVYSFVASTGMGNSTRAGTFQVLDKIPNAYGANWDIWMPNWMGIYWSGTLENGIHALPILPGGGRLWAGFLGTPISYGCVVLGVEESLQLYDWAEVGTTVEIRW